MLKLGYNHSVPTPLHPRLESLIVWPRVTIVPVSSRMNLKVRLLGEKNKIVRGRCGETHPRLGGVHSADCWMNQIPWRHSPEECVCLFNHHHEHYPQQNRPLERTLGLWICIIFRESHLPQCPSHVICAPTTLLEYQMQFQTIRWFVQVQSFCNCF